MTIASVLDRPPAQVNADLATAGPCAEEVALLADRFAKAVQALRTSKLGGSRKRLQAMPESTVCIDHAR